VPEGKHPDGRRPLLACLMLDDASGLSKHHDRIYSPI